MNKENPFHCSRFPRSDKYDARWIAENEMGSNALWLAEWLAERLPVKPGMRILDMGCGRAISSIFLAKEFGCTVFAADLWISAADNWMRVREGQLEDRVFPIHGRMRAAIVFPQKGSKVIEAAAFPRYGHGRIFQLRVRPQISTI